MKQLYLFFLFLSFILGSYGEASAVEKWDVKILSLVPHDSQAFTQGLLFVGADLYESTGRYGQSALRQIDVQNGKVVREVKLDKNYFGEGIALVKDKLIQLTWKEKKAFIYDIKTFKLVGQVSYEGEGWGLCSDGQHLFMSNGTDQIAVRDPVTFEKKKTLKVMLEGKPVTRLNALAIVGNDLYANVWLCDYIVKIDKTTGCVTAVIDARTLLTKKEREQIEKEGVLNGIAYHPERRTFFLTGKKWPFLFEVSFVSTAR